MTGRGAKSTAKEKPAKIAHPPFTAANCWAVCVEGRGVDVKFSYDTRDIISAPSQSPQGNWLGV